MSTICNTELPRRQIVGGQMASSGPDGSLDELWSFKLEHDPSDDLPTYCSMEMINTGWTSYCVCMKEWPMVALSV